MVDPADEAEAMFLGDDLLPLLVLAFGAALAVGTGLALVRPRYDEDGDLMPKPAFGRSVVMILIGLVAALWAIASLVA